MDAQPTAIARRKLGCDGDVLGIESSGRRQLHILQHSGTRIRAHRCSPAKSRAQCNSYDPMGRLVRIQFLDVEAGEAAVRPVGIGCELHMVEDDGRRVRCWSHVSRVQRAARCPKSASGKSLVELSSRPPLRINRHVYICERLDGECDWHIPNGRANHNQSSKRQCEHRRRACTTSRPASQSKFE